MLAGEPLVQVFDLHGPLLKLGAHEFNPVSKPIAQYAAKVHQEEYFKHENDDAQDEKGGRLSYDLQEHVVVGEIEIEVGGVGDDKRVAGDHDACESVENEGAHLVDHEGHNV